MEPDAPDLDEEVDAGDEWGPQMAIPGYIVEPGEDEYRHRVGGDSWKAVDTESPDVPPMLLLTLDLRDLRLAALRVEGVDELPLAFHVNLEWPETQAFRIEPETRTIRLVQKSVEGSTPLPGDVQAPNPLPETRVRLRPMTEADWPLDWDSFERLESEFDGGPNFIRVLGPPIWLHHVEEVDCSCGAPMPYICGIGREIEGVENTQMSGFIPGGEFRFGNGVFYFFLCRRCRTIETRSQCT